MFTDVQLFARQVNLAELAADSPVLLPDGTVIKHYDQ